MALGIVICPLLVILAVKLALIMARSRLPFPVSLPYGKELMEGNQTRDRSTAFAYSIRPALFAAAVAAFRPAMRPNVTAGPYDPPPPM